MKIKSSGSAQMSWNFAAAWALVITRNRTVPLDSRLISPRAIKCSQENPNRDGGNWNRWQKKSTPSAGHFRPRCRRVVTPCQTPISTRHGGSGRDVPGTLARTTMTFAFWRLLTGSAGAENQDPDCLQNLSIIGFRSELARTNWHSGRLNEGCNVNRPRPLPRLNSVHDRDDAIITAKEGRWPALGREAQVCSRLPTRLEIVFRWATGRRRAGTCTNEERPLLPLECRTRLRK